MNNSQEDIELIERFFRQELTEDEMPSFEKRVKEDALFADDLKLMRDIFYSVKWVARKNLKEELNSIENEMLTQKLKPYRPYLKKWIKWILGIFISVILIIIVIQLVNSWALDKVKSKDNPADSILPEYIGDASTLIKDPSDSAYFDVPADLKLEVKDPSTFEIKRIGVSEDGLYKYEIKADGKTQVVSSPNPDLSDELLKRRDSDTTTEIRKEKNTEGIDSLRRK